MEYLLKPWLAKKSVNIFVGRASVGKTHLVIQAAQYFREQLEPIVHVTADRLIEHTEEVFTRLNIPPWKLISKVDEDAAEWTKRTKGSTKKEAWSAYFDWMTDRIEKLPEKPKFLILDPGQLFVPCSDVNKTQPAAQGLAKLAAWTSHIETTVLLIWHANKAQKALLNDPFDALAGSTALQGYSCTKLLLEPPNNGGNYALTIRGQHFPDQVMELARSSQDGSFVFVAADAGKSIPPSVDSKVNSILPYIPLIGHPGIKAIQLVELTGKSEATVHRYLNTLHSNNQVIRDDNGFWFRFTLPN